MAIFGIAVATKREADKNTEMSICAAMIDHILRGAPDGETAIEIAAKLSALTSGGLTTIRLHIKNRKTS